METGFKIKKLDLKNVDENKRIILVSDLHGRYDLLDKLLKKVNYNQDDYLFFLGDLIEKSLSNLKTLDYVMNLVNQRNTYVLLGNCDNIYRYIQIEPKPKALLNFALFKGNSIVNEMAYSLGIELNVYTNMDEVFVQIEDKFSKYLSFLDSLPHIIETDKLLLAHAALNPKLKDYGKDAYDIIKQDEFLLNDYYFDKYVIVGHYPTINYQNEIPSFNPLINKDKKIIAIDGGNMVHPYGQLNALMIDSLKTMNFTEDYVDDFKIVRVKNEVKAQNLHSINLNWHNNQIEVLK